MLLDKLIVKIGEQNILECQQSIEQLGINIGISDFSSTIVTSARITSMRSLLNLLETYNNQLIAIENGDKRWN